VLAGEVEVPVFLEVAVADHCAQAEDGFGCVQAAPEEIASAISYLAGDQASFVHGAVLDVDGGRNAA
jgi:NAD(P)-dependent dehydrogenase (short-subunit alcohol dehydrogenase family)